LSAWPHDRDRWEQPYLGYLFTRPYRNGVDAVKAITRLGDAAAAARATRVVVAWKHADLHISKRGGGDYANGCGGRGRVPARRAHTALAPRRAGRWQR
jgi:hypothetical protein